MSHFNELFEKTIFYWFYTTISTELFRNWFIRLVSLRTVISRETDNSSLVSSLKDQYSYVSLTRPRVFARFQISQSIEFSK